MKLAFYIYRLILSPAIQVAFDVRCRYEESCSKYMERSIEQYGFLKGSARGLRRLLSCSKWSVNG